MRTCAANRTTPRLDPPTPELPVRFFPSPFLRERRGLFWNIFCDWDKSRRQQEYLANEEERA
jgi:hypothetical protein